MLSIENMNAPEKYENEQDEEEKVYNDIILHMYMYTPKQCNFAFTQGFFRVHIIFSTGLYLSLSFVCTGWFRLGRFILGFSKMVWAYIITKFLFILIVG